MTLSFSYVFAAIAASAVLTAGPQEEAAELYSRGAASYQTHDFDAAIESFTAAFSVAQSIDDEEKRERVLSRLRFNLARAHVAAFDIDGDVEHLRVARRLVNDYRGAAREAGRDPDADTDVADIEQELALREQNAGEPAADAADDPTQGPATTGQGGDTPGTATGPSASDDAAPGRSLRIAGYTSLGLSLPFVAIGAVGSIRGQAAESSFKSALTLDERNAADRRGDNANTMAYVGYIGAGVAVITGATLLGLAARKRSAAAAKHQLQVGAYADGRRTALSFGGRF